MIYLTDPSSFDSENSGRYKASRQQNSDCEGSASSQEHPPHYSVENGFFKPKNKASGNMFHEFQDTIIL